MVSIQSEEVLITGEFYYYYLYLFKKFNSNLSNDASRNFKQFFKIRNILNSFVNTTHLFEFLQINNNKNLNKFTDHNIRSKFENYTGDNLNDYFTINSCFIKKNKTLDLKLFTLFFSFNYSLHNRQLKSNHSFKLFYVKDRLGSVTVVDSAQFLMRWKDAYDFLYNIFLYKLNPVILGSPIFKDETLALNWNYEHFDINLWRYYFPFFIFKTNTYSNRVNFFINKLTQHGVNFYLITDCNYHYKNMHYINKKRLYSIGLINANISPWLVTYPIISFFDSYSTQSFFFKLIIYIEREAAFFNFKQINQIWANFLNSKII